MDKQAVSWPTVGRYAAGGLITGAGSAALINLVRYIREMRKDEEEKAKEIPGSTTEDTIVVTLPKKTAAVNLSMTSPMSKTLVGPKTTSQPRRYNGTVGPSTTGSSTKVSEWLKDAAGWPTLTLSAVAAVGGGTLGAMLVNKIYENKRQQQLEDELKATQEQYMANLPQKQADDPSGNVFGFLNYPMAAAALLGLLGVGGTAYITKRMLDEKLRASSEEGLDVPKVKRIVFRTQPDVPVAKQATAEDIEAVKATLGVVMDRLDSETRILSEPYVKAAMVEAKTCATTLMKMAGVDTDTLMEYMRQTPTLRKMIIRASMENHPMLRHFKWTYDIPGFKQMADRKLYSKMEGAFNPKPMMQNKARMVGGGEGKTTMASAKEAAFDVTREVLTSMMGSTLADQGSSKQLAKAIVDAQAQAAAERKRKKQPSPDEVASNVKLEASDPQAQAYLEANKQKVLKVVKNLAVAGKI